MATTDSSSSSSSSSSIDWLASDEDDADSLRGSSPPRVVSSPIWDSPSCDSAPAACRRRRSQHFGGGPDSVAALEVPAQGFSSMFERLPVAVEHHVFRKRDTESQLFWHKCWELQCYVQPLASILRGLQLGRYSERLSSFQESVAMDRIQRIMGVLQNPNLGGRFLNIIMKIEEMLLNWFPHVKARHTEEDCAPAKKPKQHHSCASTAPLSPSCCSDMESAASFSTHLQWFKASRICSQTLPEQTLRSHAPSPTLAHQGQEVTQDNAVSSTTDSLAAPPYHISSARPRLAQPPPPFKISSPCLERLLQAKESIIAPRTVGEGTWSPYLPAEHFARCQGVPQKLEAEDELRPDRQRKTSVRLNDSKNILL